VAKKPDSDYVAMEASRSIKYTEVFSPIIDGGKQVRRWTVEDLPDILTAECCDGRKTLPDMIRCLTGMIYLSKRAANLFRKFNLGNAHFTPLRIVSNTDRNPIGECELLTSELIEFVDLARSSFVPLSQNPKDPLIVLYFTAPPVVIHEKLNGLDFAQGMEVRSVCSKALMKAITQEKLTNFNFTEVNVQ